MKKLSLFLGTIGGAVAGYVFSNTKLREELAKAKDAEEAGRILAKHLSSDGKQIGKEVKSLVDSDVVQKNMNMAKKYVKTNAKKLQGDLKAMVTGGVKPAKKAVSKVVKSAKKVTKKVSKSKA